MNKMNTITGTLKIYAFTLATLTVTLSSSTLHAFDCVLDYNGDGIADGTSEAVSDNHKGRVACGYDAKAKGIGTTAVGVQASALDDFSTALGRLSSASGDSSTAVGEQSSASQLYSTAVGVHASAASSFSTALGASTSAAGQNSTAVGTGASAAGDYSTALGQHSSATGYNSTTLGQASSVTGAHSVAFGASSLVAGSNSTGLGSGSQASGSYAVSVGRQAYVGGDNSTALGYKAYISRNSVQSIAIGSRANVSTAVDGIAIGGIAIGADVDGNRYGARAMAEGAIAIGADVVNDVPHSMRIEVPLHLKNNAGAAKIFVEESGRSATRTLLEISNPGNTKLAITNSNIGVTWAFANAGKGLRLSNESTSAIEFEIFNNGDATLAGALTQNSDINAKQDIEQVNQQNILQKVAALPISEWSYKDAPNSRHIGPMAQDFYAAFNLGNTEKGLSTIDTGGVALAAIQALSKENITLKYELRKQKLVQKQQERKLLKINTKQDFRMMRLENMLVELLQKQGTTLKVTSID